MMKNWLKIAGHKSKKASIATNTKRKNRASYLQRLAAGWMIMQLFLVGSPVLANKEKQTLSYSELLEKLDTGEVKTVEIDPTLKKAIVRLNSQAEKRFSPRS